MLCYKGVRLVIYFFLIASCFSCAETTGPQPISDHIDSLLVGSWYRGVDPILFNNRLRLGFTHPIPDTAISGFRIDPHG